MRQIRSGSALDAGRLGATLAYFRRAQPTRLGLCTKAHQSRKALELTYAGAVVFHVTKKISLILDSSMETEAIASAKAGEQVSYAREILRAFGVAPSGPTFVGTDNLANQKVASGDGSPSRSKHFLRRYWVLKQRIRHGEVNLVHVPDEQMPADFLTKWIPRAKLERSLRYACGSHTYVDATDANGEHSGGVLACCAGPVEKRRETLCVTSARDMYAGV